MRKVIVTSLAVGLVLAGSLWASEPKGKTEAAKAPEAKLTGEVICLSCYMDDEAMGAKHAACAASCAKRGVPMAILEEKTGNVYPVVKGNTGANESLQPYAGKRVTLTGKWFARGGIKVFNLASVAEAK